MENQQRLPESAEQGSPQGLHSQRQEEKSSRVREPMGRQGKEGLCQKGLF